MSWNTYVERRINLNNPQEVAEIKGFLQAFSLDYDGQVDYTVGLYDHHDKLVGTGSLHGEVLRNMAVDESLQGEGLTGTIVGHLIREAAARNIYHYFIFTQPKKVKMFEGLGFVEIARAEPYAAVLESGMGSIDYFCASIAKQAEKLPDGPRAAIVVNCNPFTLGHKSLIAKAAREMPVIVFVVQEDASLFPFDVRLRLVREGLAEFDNVLVVAGGKYIISAATFPAYFTRAEDLVAAQTRLDATVFAAKIAGKLNIVRRYVGEEPYCEVTSAYNRSMAEILPDYGLELVTIPRTGTDRGEIISASKVRECLRQDDWDALTKMVPQSTLDYLTSPQAKPIIDKIKNSQSRH